MRAVGPATRVPGAPGRGGAGLRGGAFWGRGPGRWRPWGRGLLLAPLSRRAGWARPPPARPAQAPRRVRVVWGGSSPRPGRLRQGLTRPPEKSCALTFSRLVICPRVPRLSGSQGRRSPRPDARGQLPGRPELGVGPGRSRLCPRG